MSYNHDSIWPIMAHERIQDILGREMEGAREARDRKRLAWLKDLAKRVGRGGARGMFTVGTEQLVTATKPEVSCGAITLETLLEGKIRQTVEIGGKTAQQLENELEQAGININSYARDMMHSADFTTLKDPQKLETVRVKVQDLKLSRTSTTHIIYEKAQELGLELCPAEVGPHMRLAYKDQPMGEWFVIGMKQITDRFGLPFVFGLGRRGDGLWLDVGWAGPGIRWYPEHEFVFSLRKPEALKP